MISSSREFSPGDQTWAIFSKDGKFLGCVMTDPDATNPFFDESVTGLETGMVAYPADRPLANNEIPSIEDGKCVWNLCPIREANDAAAVILERHADARQVSIWEAKEQEARSLIAKSGKPTPIITAESQATGRKPLDLAKDIIRRADEDRAALAAAFAHVEARRRAEKVAK